jgi:hypothetical protein
MLNLMRIDIRIYNMLIFSMTSKFKVYILIVKYAASVKTA